jgi:hypothetical protein
VRFDDGTPIYNDAAAEILGEQVPCRLDTLWSPVYPTHERTSSGGVYEERHGTLYLRAPLPNFDASCIIDLDGHVYEIIGLHEVLGFRGLHHYEVEVREHEHR